MAVVPRIVNDCQAFAMVTALMRRLRQTIARRSRAHSTSAADTAQTMNRTDKVKTNHEFGDLCFPKD
jgi:hypothetical protein